VKTAFLLLVTLLASTAFADDLSAKKDSANSPVYTVREYDSKRDPEQDLKRTIQIASKDGRRILLVVGGDWCAWCRRLEREFSANAEIAAVLASSYVIMKVSVSDDNGNLYFLQDYPDIDEYPHFYVLDAAGKLLHSQPNRAFERLGGYKSASMLEFLKKWAPTKSAK
jgi:thioredoxin-related protein